MAQGHLDVVEGYPVVDHARAGLGHAVGDGGVRWDDVRWAAAAQEDPGEDGGVEAAEGGADEGDVADLARPAELLDPLGLESGQHRDGGVGEDGPGDHGQPTDVRQREAAEPVVATGIDAQALGGHLGAGQEGIVREDHPFGDPRGAAGGQDHGIALFDRLPIPDSDLFAVRPDQTRRPKRVEQGIPGGPGEAGIDGGRRVTGVPDGSEGIDESSATREVNGDEFRHWPVA